MKGTITSFDGADSLGWIALDDGRAVRFGLGACQKLSPAPGLRVRLGELREEAGKLKAGRVQHLSFFDAMKAKPPRNTPLDRFDFRGPGGEDLGVPAGFLMQWLVLNDQLSPAFVSFAVEAITRVKAEELTGRRFVTEVCDERPMRADLSREGLRFWDFYYGKAGLLGLFKSRFEKDLAKVGRGQVAVLAAIGAAFRDWRAKQ